MEKGEKMGEILRNRYMKRQGGRCDIEMGEHVFVGEHNNLFILVPAARVVSEVVVAEKEVSD
jgi:hypothetical protein